MKSLKRTLCLVLALVMVLGLFGIASATNFTDDNTIQYKEAVDVMTGIGAIEGYTDGTFNPKGTINRAEAAKLVTYAILGSATASKLSSVSSSFSDVDAANWGWAIPSIEYLVKEGVINGRGDGTFDPKGNITGYEVGKMLLCALGYGAKGEYVGAQWSLNVAIDGARVGAGTVASGTTNPTPTGRLAVFSGRADDATALSAPATREEVALYCFNTIQKQQVEYISTLDIYAGESSDLGNKLGSIAENVYPTLRKDVSGTDEFANPTIVWKLGRTSIYNALAPATITYTSAKKFDDLKKELKGYTLKGAPSSHDVKAYINSKTNVAQLNGASASASFTTIGNANNLGTDLAAFLAVDATTNSNHVLKQSGNGTVVRIYTSPDNATEITKVTVVTSTLVTVTNINNATGTATLSDGSRIDKDLQPALFAKVSGLKADDPVIITKAGTTVQSVTIPTAVSGKVTRVTDAGVITLENGQSYGTAAAATFGKVVPDAGNNVDMLLDEYGYVVKWEPAKAAAAKETFGYVLESHDGVVGDRVVKISTIAFANGEIKAVPAVNAADKEKLVEAHLYKLTDMTDKTGTWTGVVITEDPTEADADTRGILQTLAGAANAKADAGVIALATYGAGPATVKGKVDSTDKALKIENNSDKAASPTKFYDNYYSENVKFIFISGNGTTIPYSAKVMSGVTACEIPAFDTNAYSYAVLEKASDNPNSANVVTAMFIKGGAPTAATDPAQIMFIPDVSKPTKVSAVIDGVEKKFDNYTALVNGVPVEGGATIASGMADTPAPGFYSFAKSATVPNAYDISLIAPDKGGAYLTNNVAGIADANDHVGNYFKVKLSTGPDTFAIVNLGSAAIVDLRSAADQDKVPVTCSVAGLHKALVNNNLTLGILFDATKGNQASIVYIVGTAGLKELTLGNATGTAAGKVDSSWSKTKINQGDTVTLTVKIKTDVTAGKKYQIAITNGDVLSCTGTGATVAGANVTIAEANAKAGNVFTVTVWAKQGTAPSAEITEES